MQPENMMKKVLGKMVTDFSKLFDLKIGHS